MSDLDDNLCPHSLLAIIKQEFISRCQLNSQYSLRAFSKRLGIDPSVLSKILNEKRKISKKMSAHLMQVLNLSESDIDKLKNRKSENDYQHLDKETFEEIHRWYHFAVLELIRLDRFRPTVSWVSKALNLDQAVAKKAISTLEKWGFLNTKEDNWAENKVNCSTTQINHTSVAQKQLQREVLGLGIEALDNVDYNVRDHSSMTMAIDKKNLPKAKELIKKFRREMASLLEKGNLTDVYHLGVCLYPVTNLEKK